MEYMKFFEFKDFIGFATYLKVDKKTIKDCFLSAAKGDVNLEDLVCETVEKFSSTTRKFRRQILKMARDIKKDNIQSGVKMVYVGEEGADGR